MEGQSALSDILVEASREFSGFEYEQECACIFAFETLCEQLILKSREFDVFELAGQLQELWDHMFGIDVMPENEVRFGVNFFEIAGRISEYRGVACRS